MSRLDPLLTIACVVHNQARTLAAFHSRLASEIRVFRSSLTCSMSTMGATTGPIKCYVG